MLKSLYAQYGIDETLYAASERALARSQAAFKQIREREACWQLRVIKAFQKFGLTEQSLAGSTGYGYDDQGREKLELALAELFGAEAALLRHQFSSGTHVLATCLKALLRPGERVLLASGMVYDTLKTTFGFAGEGDTGSLKDFQVGVDLVELKADGSLDLPALEAAVRDQHYKLVYLQKSRGYSLRPSLLNRDMAAVAARLRAIDPELIFMVDNCYGEFVEDEEPTALGLDLCAGSLIKNLGAGIAPTGGYICGKRQLVELCAQQMTAPGVGEHVGPTLGISRDLARGLFYAPHAVAEALRSAVHAAALFSERGLNLQPAVDEVRGDIVQILELGSPEKLIAFCVAIQSASAVDAAFAPIPAPMPGYDCDIIMASGSFIQGSSIELSCDGPLRPPYAAFLQGGLSFEQGRYAQLLALKALEQIQG